MGKLFCQRNIFIQARGSSHADTTGARSDRPHSRIAESRRVQHRVPVYTLLYECCSGWPLTRLGRRPFRFLTDRPRRKPATEQPLAYVSRGLICQPPRIADATLCLFRNVLPRSDRQFIGPRYVQDLRLIVVVKRPLRFLIVLVKSATTNEVKPELVFDIILDRCRNQEAQTRE